MFVQNVHKYRSFSDSKMAARDWFHEIDGLADCTLIRDREHYHAPLFDLFHCMLLNNIIPSSSEQQNKPDEAANLSVCYFLETGPTAQRFTVQSEMGDGTMVITSWKMKTKFV